ncbi:hypothetical protein CC2G_006736, partial [Coprinopsis cinerea AmutBmut pab1-1]
MNLFSRPHVPKEPALKSQYLPLDHAQSSPFHLRERLGTSTPRRTGEEDYARPSQLKGDLANHPKS